jgi:hypothetical protein
MRCSALLCFVLFEQFYVPTASPENPLIRLLFIFACIVALFFVAGAMLS